MENKEQHVDWAGLVYYDAKIKEYINSSTASKEEQVQLRSDLEQLEQLLTTLTMSFATDKDHIYKHINECMNGSATKEELQTALDAIREEIKTLTGVDLSDYATKDFVEQKLDDLQLSVELPDDLVTTEDIKDFVTRQDVAEEIGKIVPPEVDLTSLATKEELSAVEAMIPSVKGLASETYVDEKVASIIIPEVPTKMSELENDAGYITAADIPEADLSDYYNKTEVEEIVAEAVSSIEHPTVNLDGYATEEYVDNAIAGIEIPEVDLTDYATKDDVAQIEAKIPSVYGLATEKFVADKIAEIEHPANPTKVSELENDAGYITADEQRQVFEIFAGFAYNKDEYQEYSVSVDLDAFMKAPYQSALMVKYDLKTYNADYIIDDNNSFSVYADITPVGDYNAKTFRQTLLRLQVNKDSDGTWTAGRTIKSIPLATTEYITDSINAIKIPEVPTNISTFTNDAGYLTDVPEEYVTDEELEAKGYLTEHQSLEGLATEQFVADEIAKLDCVSSTTVENIIEEKIEEVVTGGTTVSSISYGTF